MPPLDTRIATFDHGHEAELAKLYLDSVGIPSRLQGSLSERSDPILILVAAEDSGRASTLLEEHRQSIRRPLGVPSGGGSFVVGFLVGVLVGVPVLIFAVNRLERESTRRGFWFGLTTQALLLLSARSLLR